MDLHMHTSASDGCMQPEELIAELNHRGIRYAAITDHDTVDGYLAAREEAKRQGVSLISGVEWNTDGPDGELHILGYGFDLQAPGLHYLLDRRKRERLEWAAEIVERCRALGMPISFEACVARAQGGVVVRTHIAEELADHGYGRSPQAIFEQYLRKGQAAYMPRPSFSAREAIEATHEIGGIAILAHPGIYSFEVNLSALLSYGLDGIEVYYSKHTPAQTVKWEREAKKHNLIRSGGSDFHGHGSRNPQLPGSVGMPPEVKEWWTCCMFHQH
ncbi:PHP domain-containing protein [Brevibacillus ruminantium]|uniref:PHP domain-containing protein n=1 Tax=Brevibacillus ruminantium TaxID=2950604 RepID=A0ABY4WJ81_9BACL|nr:PHP domain-containing protein [Brevibacillus ruminantium]USG66218.1 PHP domain-containing protein [Brevibacillus ruminantium]